MEYSNRQIIQSLLWLGNEKIDICENKECRSGLSLCPDQEQMTLLETLLNDMPSQTLSFQLSPFWNFSEKTEAEICPDSCAPRSLLRPSIGNAEMEKCLNSKTSFFSNTAGEKLMRAVPLVLGINSCSEIQERNSVVRFCLDNICCETILSVILQEILVEILKCYADTNDLSAITSFLENFFTTFEETLCKCSESKELTNCVKSYYTAIAQNLKKIRQDRLCNKYNLLYSRWKREAEQEHATSLAKYFEYGQNGWENLKWLLYSIQSACSIAGFPCSLPHEIQQRELVAENGIPPAIQRLEQFLSGLTQIEEKAAKEKLIIRAINIVTQQGVNWDLALLNNLLNDLDSYQNGTLIL